MGIKIDFKLEIDYTIDFELGQIVPVVEKVLSLYIVFVY